MDTYPFLKGKILGGIMKQFYDKFDNVFIMEHTQYELLEEIKKILRSDNIEM